MLNKAQIIDRITSRVETLDPQKVTKSIVLYRLVRHLFDQNPNVEENIEFRWAYAAFYGLNHYKRSDLPTYFQVLHRHYLLKDSSMDINEIDEMGNVFIKIYVQGINEIPKDVETAVIY